MNGIAFLFSLCCNSAKIFTFVAKVKIHFHFMRLKIRIAGLTNKDVIHLLRLFLDPFNTTEIRINLLI